MTVGFAAFHIPSESMQPSLEVGDRVLVSKWAYGYSRHSLPLGIGYMLPDNWNARLAWSEPRRGDVVVSGSYSHLRAHENGSNLVWRRPPEIANY